MREMVRETRGGRRWIYEGEGEGNNRREGGIAKQEGEGD